MIDLIMKIGCQMFVGGVVVCFIGLLVWLFAKAIMKGGTDNE